MLVQNLLFFLFQNNRVKRLLDLRTLQGVFGISGLPGFLDTIEDMECALQHDIGEDLEDLLEGEMVGDVGLVVGDLALAGQVHLGLELLLEVLHLLVLLELALHGALEGLFRGRELLVDLFADLLDLLRDARVREQVLFDLFVG